MANNNKIVKEEKKLDFAFGRENYIIMIIGLGVLALGYLLLVGGNSTDFNTFNEEVFNFRRLTLAPIVLVIGFIIEIFAIMKKPKEQA